jgi:hypothetical protein
VLDDGRFMPFLNDYLINGTGWSKELMVALMRRKPDARAPYFAAVLQLWTRLSLTSVDPLFKREPGMSAEEFAAFLPVAATLPAASANPGIRKTIDDSLGAAKNLTPDQRRRIIDSALTVLAEGSPEIRMFAIRTLAAYVDAMGYDGFTADRVRECQAWKTGSGPERAELLSVWVRLEPDDQEVEDVVAPLAASMEQRERHIAMGGLRDAAFRTAALAGTMVNLLNDQAAPLGIADDERLRFPDSPFLKSGSIAAAEFISRYHANQRGRGYVPLTESPFTPALVTALAGPANDNVRISQLKAAHKSWSPEVIELVAGFAMLGSPEIAEQAAFTLAFCDGGNRTQMLHALLSGFTLVKDMERWSFALRTIDAGLANYAVAERTPEIEALCLAVMRTRQPAIVAITLEVYSMIQPPNE